MKFKEYKQLDYAALAEEILREWNEKDVFEKSMTTREGQPTFTFYEGPPSANGTPGIHHVMARTVKDIVCRYKTQKGFQVKRKGGWDTHGLPVELQVEKKLGITKEDIGKKISVADYNKACRESVMEFKGEWDELTQKMGYWVDLENPYITFEKDYIETLWYLLKELHKKNFLYKGYTIQPYSPAAGTGLSSHELNQPGTYKDVKDTSIVAQFKVVKDEKSAFLFEGESNDVFILAWTTTPWTLPSNAALAVGKSISYVKVRTINKYTKEPITVVLAKELLEKHLPQDKEGENQVVAEMTGANLEGVSYEQLMPYVTPEEPAFKVIIGDFVSTEDGTGIVHIAPTFGADDARVAKLAGIPGVVIKDDQGNELPLVDKQGRFVKEVTDFPLAYVKDAYESDEVLNAEGYKPTDVLIAIKLKEENKAFDVKKYEHSYPHCWRTDKPILYYPMESWFVRTTAVKDRLVELNKTINWKPESTGVGRFGNWLENLVDWNLSRSRFWGTPLPIWRNEDGTQEKCIGSMAELEEEMAKANSALSDVNNPATLDDLHRPYVDDVILVSDSGEPMKRESDLIDVWFDSGAMPYAQWHYPFENTEDQEKNFPADFIAEGVDQTRGWFFTLHAISVMLFDSVAFKNVIANGLVLDKKGNKMSKRSGNAVDPFETIAKYGPDATRWYMIANAPPWDNLKFNIDGVAETQRRFFSTFQNTYNFFALYANLDGFDPSTPAIPVDQRPESDRWVLSKLHSLIATTDAAFEDYDLTSAARAIQEFVIDDVSNWYVRLNRKRFWKQSDDKAAAYQTLFECLEITARLASNIAPFYFERVYKDLTLGAGESVHLGDFPVVDESIIDKDLEVRMDLAQKLSSLVHSLRKGENIKVRQPLSKILVPVSSEEFKSHVQAVEKLICSEVNVKSIEYLDGSGGILVKRVKANFKMLGKQYGPQMKTLAGIIAKLDQDQISAIESGSLEIDLEGTPVSLTKEDVDISFDDIPGWLVASEGGVTVALDITISDDLRAEGLARDLVNRIQNLRKDQGLEVQDQIVIELATTEELLISAFNAFNTYICSETQAVELKIVETVQDAERIEMDEWAFEVKIEVSKLSAAHS